MKAVFGLVVRDCKMLIINFGPQIILTLILQFLKLECQSTFRVEILHRYVVLGHILVDAGKLSSNVSHIMMVILLMTRILKRRDFLLLKVFSLFQDLRRLVL